MPPASPGPKSSASNNAPDGLTDSEASALQRALDAYEPKDVHGSLDAIDLKSLRGAQAGASGPLVGGDGEPGVFVTKLEGGRVRLRVAYSDINGAVYDELDMPAATLKGLVETLLADLAAKKAPRTP